MSNTNNPPEVTLPSKDLGIVQRAIDAGLKAMRDCQHNAHGGKVCFDGDEWHERWALLSEARRVVSSPVETPAVHSGMRKVLAECDEYLSRSPAEAIHAGSILHQAIKNTLKAKSASPAVRNDWCVCEACLTTRRKAQAQEASSIDECLCATKSNGDMIETHLVCPVHGTLKATGEQS